mmetsp:Transcript_35165/g.113873  ORF Transcript_35165/g.113873 Transcript_35165/m.113873 type:complete len:232 (+) Transcript_35165:80-775(+)
MQRRCQGQFRRKRLSHAPSHMHVKRVLRIARNVQVLWRSREVCGAAPLEYDENAEIHRRNRQQPIWHVHVRVHVQHTLHQCASGTSDFARCQDQATIHHVSDNTVRLHGGQVRADCCYPSRVHRYDDLLMGISRNKTIHGLRREYAGAVTERPGQLRLQLAHQPERALGAEDPRPFQAQAAEGRSPAVPEVNLVEKRGEVEQRRIHLCLSTHPDNALTLQGALVEARDARI